MKFEELHATIPYAKGGKEKSLEMKPYSGITLAMPGRHALDTVPIGGDFVVMVTDKTVKWTRHQFTHTDLFKDVEARTQVAADHAERIIGDYLAIIQGADPNFYTNGYTNVVVPGVVQPITFLRAVQCLAVAEHRRYHQFESKFGGRYLPFRFAAGIVEGLWTAADAASMERRGRPGVEILEKIHGKPELTRELIK